MGTAILAYGKTGVRAGDLYIKPGIADAVADLIQSAAGNEYGKAAGENSFAHSCHACGNTNHIGFRDACIEKALRADFGKSSAFGRLGQVCIHNDKVFFLGGQFCQCFAVGISGGHGFDLSHFIILPG